ncbi:CWC16 protein [Schizothecium vesticola]|uniref:CWC16 protein n=1 Tax=Schizothecium vesticola TaxID=314040 RepID=A0AA40K2E2_9PEZI|nr:CWC16 protein [Schizothecium vesticola]
MQGFNMGRYHPPDGPPVPPRRKTNSTPSTPPTIRFETPFPLWCAHCPTPTLIPQGARHNALKRLVGHYHSTPLWSFSFRHTACSGAVEIRTDPARGDYVVHSGGVRQVKAGDRAEGGESLVATGTGLILGGKGEEERETALGRLERTIADREREAVAKERIEELEEEGGRRWGDPYAVNARLRRGFRVGRKRREEEGRGVEALRERVGWGEGLVVVEGTEEDGVRAGLVDFGAGRGDGVEEALRRGLFEGGEKKGGEKKGGEKKGGGRKMLKKETAAERARRALGREVVGNTRAAKDPFLVGLGGGEREVLMKGPVRIPGLKRKRDVGDEGQELTPPPTTNAEKSPGGEKDVARTVPAATGSASTALVSYASDSE